MKTFFNSNSNIIIGKTYKVKKILGENLFKKRLNSLGIIENSKITIYKKAPLGDPIIIKINDSTIALRKKFLKNIILEGILKNENCTDRKSKCWKNNYF